MAGDGSAQTLTVPADLSAFPQLVAWAEDLARELMLPSSTSYAIQLCLEEAFTNIVRHGFADAGPCVNGREQVRIAAEMVEGDVVLTIEDSGVPFNPLEYRSVVAPAGSIEDAVVGGQGIRLMRRFAQQMDYEWRNDRNCLRLRFTVSA